jgi:hypothetical protein
MRRTRTPGEHSRQLPQHRGLVKNESRLALKGAKYRCRTNTPAKYDARVYDIARLARVDAARLDDRRDAHASVERADGVFDGLEQVAGFDAGVRGGEFGCEPPICSGAGNAPP